MRCEGNQVEWNKHATEAEAGAMTRQTGQAQQCAQQAQVAEQLATAGDTGNSGIEECRHCEWARRRRRPRPLQGKAVRIKSAVEAPSAALIMCNCA